LARHRPRIHRALVAPGTGPRCGLGAASDAAQALSSGARHFRAGPSAHVPRCGAATGHACLAADNADWRDRLAASAVVAGTRGDPLVAVRFRHVRAVRHSKDGRGHGLAFVYKGPDGARGARADDDYRRPGAGREGPRHRLDHRLMAAGYCIGAPSIVGLSECLLEMARATKPEGHIIVSDIVWRSKPEALNKDEWKWLARTDPISLEEYSGAIVAAGLRVERTCVHERRVWDEYWRPMLDVAQEAKTSQPADIAFADDIESAVALERRAVDRYIDYATFVAKKP